MKITTLLLLVSIFCLHAEMSSSQNIRVTIRENNAELENVLNEIEKQTDYLFVYNKNVDVAQKVSVHFSKLYLQEALETIFSNLNIQYEIDGRYIILSFDKKNTEKIIPVSQQSRKKEIYGIVVDQEGLPIIGANVVEKERQMVSLRE